MQHQVSPSLTPAPSAGGCSLTGGLCSWTLFAAAESPAQPHTPGSPLGIHAIPPVCSQHWREIPATELIRMNNGRKHLLYTQGKNNTALEHRRLHALLQHMCSTGKEKHMQMSPCHAWEVIP